MTACMGGWCSQRAQCPHHESDDRRNPSERMCLPGQDGKLARHFGAKVMKVGVLDGLLPADTPARAPARFGGEA